MPFGLMNASSTFQSMMNGLLGERLFVKVYLDDAVVFSKNMQQHFPHLRKVIKLLSDHGLKIKTSKCKFVRENVPLLVHIVDQFRVNMDPKNI